MKQWMLLIVGTLLIQGLFAEEFKTWRAIGGYKVQAAFVKYEQGVVTLKKEDGSEIDVRLEKLLPRYRMEVIQLAGDHASGSIPKGQISPPKGRRELEWKPLVRGDPWHPEMTKNEKEALLEIDRNWDHAETQFFIVHYQQVGYAKRVARMADYMYQYIAADLPEYKDRVKEKSHIVVVKDTDDWKAFLKASSTAPEWSAAYVHGKVMYLQDADDRERNAEVLAHEMSHLVLNRFFVRRPPLWLNEGLAEWYGNFGWKAFKGQRVNVRDDMGDMKNPYPVEQIMSSNKIPGNDNKTIHRFYATSHQLVGMLMLEKDQTEFVKFLKRITVDGKTTDTAIQEVYGYQNRAEIQKAFDEFLD